MDDEHKKLEIAKAQHELKIREDELRLQQQQIQIDKDRLAAQQEQTQLLLQQQQHQFELEKAQLLTQQEQHNAQVQRDRDEIAQLKAQLTTLIELQQHENLFPQLTNEMAFSTIVNQRSLSLNGNSGQIVSSNHGSIPDNSTKDTTTSLTAPPPTDEVSIQLLPLISRFENNAEKRIADAVAQYGDNVILLRKAVKKLNRDRIQLEEQFSRDRLEWEGQITRERLELEELMEVMVAEKEIHDQKTKAMEEREAELTQHSLEMDPSLNFKTDIVAYCHLLHRKPMRGTYQGRLEVGSLQYRWCELWQGTFHNGSFCHQVGMLNPLRNFPFY